jgi:nucleoside-triphosphatase THEP1
MIKIITGERDSGKTSYLRYLVKGSKFFNGFLESKKYDENGKFLGYDLIDIETEEKFEFITIDLTREGTRLDKFIILEEGAKKGKDIILSGINKEKILVVDEVGQLEIDGGLFHKEIVKAMKSGIEMYITVRKELLNEFIEKFELSSRDYKLIRMGE